MQELLLIAMIFAVIVGAAYLFRRMRRGFTEFAEHDEAVQDLIAQHEAEREQRLAGERQQTALESKIAAALREQSAKRHA